MVVVSWDDDDNSVDDDDDDDFFMTWLILCHILTGWMAAHAIAYCWLDSDRIWSRCNS